jgi:peptidoglycan/xylan/chitin deacetylase (PgdA/CDA1 family)
VVSVTFDNLGEAAEIQLGAHSPRGEHFSVVEVLPRLLELLGGLDLRATFFVEGINAEVYPDALRSIADAGHEVAAHAWCHEEWAALDPAREVELLDRATAALGAIGIEPRGFRPPGGGLTEQTGRLLAERGYAYHSPAGDRERVADGLAVLPFRWPLVDAYYYMPNFAGLRESHGDGAEPLEPADLRRAMLTALDEHRESDGHLVLILHPFLLALGDEALAATTDVLTRVRELGDDGRCRLLTMTQAAESLLSASRSK